MKNSSEICVPVSALALPGENEGSNTAPAVGDTVDISGTAKVTRIEGDKAYLAPDTINGAAVQSGQAKKKDEPEDLDAAEKAMRDEASQSEKNALY
jgi:hypothetical protein